jgi:hypothetical protein
MPVHDLLSSYHPLSKDEIMTALVHAEPSCHALHFVRLLEIVRAEFLEMPGLRLTKKQAQRLWAIDSDTCEAILGALEASQFLGHTRNGEYFIV